MTAHFFVPHTNVISSFAIVLADDSIDSRAVFEFIGQCSENGEPGEDDLWMVTHYRPLPQLGEPGYAYCIQGFDCHGDMVYSTCPR